MFRLFLVTSCLLFLTACIPGIAQIKTAYKDPLTGMDFVYIKGGTFEMGSDIANWDPEKPAHQVTLDGFFVSRYEVTFEQFDKYCIATNIELLPDNGFGRADRPIINVSWEQATSYAKWLTEKSGLSYSLPTEAQWEFLARAGTTTAFWTGDKIPSNAANCDGCGSRWDAKSTAPVGSFKSNPWGIYDSLGNVAEWVMDDYHENYINAPNDGSAWLTSGEERKILRGGGWDYSKDDLRSSAREYRKRNESSGTAGFRLIIQPTAALPAPLE